MTRAAFRHLKGLRRAARRTEDVAACEILGARRPGPPFGSVDYERHGDESAVRDAIVSSGGRARMRCSSPDFP